MNDVINKSLAAKLLALSALTLMACPAPVTNDGGTGGGGGEDECGEAADCVALKGGTAAEWYCNTSTALCEPACRTNENCNPATRESDDLAQCAGALGCVCDEGKCIGSLCSDDSQCSTDGTSVCRSGNCVTPPDVATVTKCEVVPSFAVLAAGAKQTFHVSAWAGTEPVVITAGATWTATAGAGTVVGSGNKAELTAGSASFAAADAVTATFGTVTCKAQAIVITAPAAGNTVVAIDELSGRPIEGAAVAVTDSAGALQGAVATTTADGHADVTIAANQTVTVFHKDYSYLSIVNVAPATKLIAAVVRRNQVDKFGGFKGGITNLPTDNTIKAAIAGMSVAGNITNLNITQLLGPSVSTDITLSDTIKVEDVPLPSGIFLYFNKVLTGHGTPPDGKVVGLGLAGTCGDATNEKNGACGTRSAWALTGAVELTKIVSLAGAVTGGGFDLSQIGSLLGSVVPLLKNFKSSLVRDVQFSLIDTTWTAGGDADFSNVDGANFTAQDIEFGQLPLGFAFPVKLPQLPQFGGQYIDAVAVLGGANAVGRGVVPLGLGVGVNTKEPKDAVIDAIGTDGDDGYVAAGNVGVRMAPNHHGLEGSDYGLLVLGISAAAITDPSAGIGISAIFPRVDKLEFTKTAVDISANTFPSFPEGAVFNYSPTATAGRTFTVDQVANTGILRVSFSGEKERRWDVIVASGAKGATFKLPTLAAVFAANIPAGVTDRLYTNPGAANADLKRAAMTVQAFRLTSDGKGTGTAIDLNGYADLSTGIQTDTTHYLTAFSLQAFSAPSVSLSFGSATALTVEVKGASIAAGKSKVVLTTETGCTATPNLPTGDSETEAGSNAVKYVLAGCTGKTISAALIDSMGAAFDPPVGASGTGL